MTNKTITLACPFCGGEPKVTRTSGDERDGYALRISYVCKGCGCSRGASGTSAEGGYADNSTVDQRALAAWNTRAALAEPVPPAGGEAEVPTVAWLDLNKMPRAGMAYATALKVNHRQTELVDRAHITRLQAEVERLKSTCQGFVNLHAKAQSELTKARELFPNISIGVREFLSNQSAPADKGGDS